ncbi:GTPase HflX [Lysobacter capsici]|jgi:GTP-binding protein HflX|uniref:GTPase HflX n=1 Tax=Lysobacter capsici AZ78 TaxID=1444315 RepID=A0A125TZB3_9GAMM|nr:ribosome rescue GTPase HflX [Lysobacter capsici]ALN86926.1 GTP-binding protein HflX [Lysobacter capsici]KWS01997.1 GTP-binding protein HflX [Lysobacter capsici AZ78]UOF13421.1 GTPase HflX [Lysobacter capsici]WND78948.1 ribosome rescue GTPase HflX [Lysobacter capsici]WND84143.1 ribosome rescue GTPase HflX [Lysobacter capsici]
MFERSKKGEHALLIQPHAGGAPDEDLLEEFADLARSAGATVAAVITARIDKPNAAILIGSGKLDEVKAAADASGADLILVNHRLSPGQERNLEKLLERRVVDRTGLILDIFSQRAHSAEGKLQVELAQLKHMSTRLIRGWTHLERQRGGSIGLRGPGETQLETDRRLLQKRLEQLQKRLDKVEVQRTQMRRARMRSELPRVALVGYTNAGKSTLFNAMTGADAYAADQLFATLDPTVRRIDLPGGGAVLADTVGFVRDLPHDLVAAFRSTLSEAREADLLLHVIDAADPLRDERIAQVDEVLADIGAGDLPQLLVFNKIDRLDDVAPRIDRPGEGKNRVWVSARDGKGLDLLREALGEALQLRHVTGSVRIASQDARLRARLHELGAVRSEQADEHGWVVEVDLAVTDAERLFAQANGEALRPLLETVQAPT